MGPEENSEDDPCLICGEPSRGIHFGVQSCRACPAFFRRSVVNNKKYSCRLGNDNCPVDKGDRYSCRLCRYNKCVRLGMTTDNVQYSRDLFSFGNGLKKKRSSKKSNNMESAEDDDDDIMIIEPEEDPTSSKITSSTSIKNEELALNFLPAGAVKMKQFDLSGLVTIVENVFSQFVPPFHEESYRKMNKLQRMEYALAVHRCDQKKEDIQMIDNVNMEWICKKTPNRLMKIASWMMHMEEFREIEQDEQFLIFKAVWTLWEPFETVATSLDVFGERVLTEQLFVISSEFAIQYKKAWLDLSSITDYPSEPIFKMFEPFIRRIIDDVARKLYEMKVSKIEEAYMLCQLAWHLSGKELKRSTIDAGDRFLEEIANDLHEYYMDINLGHYAARLIQLMNIVNDWKKIFMDRQKVLELAKLFDVFNVVPSEPDLLFYPS